MLETISHKVAPPFEFASGPRNAKIAIVGEAHGEQEERIGFPFVGQSGQELTRMLKEAGLERGACFLTNTLAFRPPGNKLEAICVSKAEVGKDYTLPPLGTGKYLPWEYLGELDRLKAELSAVRPNLVLALGAVASWALLGTAKIGGIRGTAATSPWGYKVLPTYHPAGVLRNWAWRPIVVADLMKAKREAEYPEVRRPQRFVLVNPTLREVRTWVRETLEASPSVLACDIETSRRTITHIGFARSRSEALVIPFTNSLAEDGSYWPTAEEECEAWAAARTLLESHVPKLFQNGMYDLQYIAQMGIRPRRCLHDTMLLHHSMYPELQKGLGFLGSVYTNEASWKLMRHEESTKRDE